jgi:hypothetical protein
VTELLALLALLPLDILPPSSPSVTASAASTASAVYAKHGNGFAAYIVGGFFALGLIVVATILISLRPKRSDSGGIER